MNLPNRLTILRLILTLPFVAALSLPFAGAKWLALCLFVVSSATDYADGYIARKFQLITDFGKLMDPLVDKIMTMSAFICLVALGSIPAWAAIVIISREFLITGLRLIASARGKVLAAERLGKLKTVCQIVTILYCLIVVATHRPIRAFLELAGGDIAQRNRTNSRPANRCADSLVRHQLLRQKLVPDKRSLEEMATKERRIFNHRFHRLHRLGNGLAFGRVTILAKVRLGLMPRFQRRVLNRSC